MANNLIQIKRTSVSGRAANTTTLSNPGELALNMADGILYSGNGTFVFEIGANTTNSRVSGNLIVNSIVANGSVGNAGYVLSSNGSSAYWSDIVGYSGSIGYVGSVGYVGSKGNLGYTGSAGYIGQDGYTGSIGYTGSVGQPFNFNIQSNIFTGNGSNTVFTLYTGNTTQNSVIVAINGVVQQPGAAYNILGSNNIITFNGTPSNGSLIEIKNLSGGLIGQTGYQGSAGAPGGPTGYTGSAGTGFTGSAGYVGSTGPIQTVVPVSNKTSSYIAANTDTGGLISITSGGVTINQNIFTAGQNILIWNNSATNQTITQGTGVTMYLSPGGTTGNRTLSGRGLCSIVCVASNVFVISGSVT